MKSKYSSISHVIPINQAENFTDDSLEDKIDAKLTEYGFCRDDEGVRGENRTIRYLNRQGHITVLVCDEGDKKLRFTTANKRIKTAQAVVEFHNFRYIPRLESELRELPGS